MKIFNWVQRRFHHSAIKENWTDGSARNAKKAESITSEADKQALLKQVALVDVLDGWKDGILTIGTLGLDPLKPFNQQNEYFVLESEEVVEDDDDEYNHEADEQEQYSVYSDEEDSNINEDEEEEEEENPLIYTRFEHNFEELASTFDANAGKSKEIMIIDPMETNSNVHENSERKRKGERITLAELFLADSDMKKKTESFELKSDSGKKQAVRAKNGLFFAKKLIPHVGEDSRPIKKFHQLMRRMLKRKIHPELEEKDQKIDNQNKTAIMEVGISNGNETGESISLLPTPPRSYI
ncbi:hypothetical protein P3X46_014906 [Hevea brasiliensis]|uniref:Protein TILLER ANGLE CONTROL 1 n=1 Tax=Hevea brasiliensis TaxID=3981 RepID=A0ABQ9LWF2_HEVBR|nr:protein TILLER ANGLE CONTROL 1-like [Hevea brasiliensis]KAJ9171552.1 hypothetical protein P3X46_014906 [Hevea brasiliensis]